MKTDLPYISLQDFNEKVDEWAKDNFIFKNIKQHNPDWTWQELPYYLKQELFEKIGAKPDIKLY